MIRRALIALAALAAFSVHGLATEIGDDGLHKEDWFSLTFRDVAEDIASAKEEGKRLVMVFEQRGCIYCAKMHETLLSDPEVSDFIKAKTPATCGDAMEVPCSPR